MKSFVFDKCNKINGLFLVTVIWFIGLLTFGSYAHSADHIDSPFLSELGADIADLYAFPSPKDKNKLVVVLNTNSGALPEAYSKNTSRFKIVIKNLEKNDSPQYPDTFFKASNTLYEIQCDFFADGIPLVHSYGYRHCKFTNRTGTSVTEHTYAGSTYNYGNRGSIYDDLGIKMFTGLRADPFFISVSAFDTVVRRQGNFHEFRAEQGDKVNNGIANVNVLSMIFEIDLQKVKLPKGLIGIAAQSYELNDNKYEAIDRAGRPELMNVGFHDYTNKKSHISGGSFPVKRDFNTSTIFQTPSRGYQTYYDRFVENVYLYDQIGDDVINWNSSDLNRLASLFVHDYLVLNINDNCRGNKAEYLSVEKEVLAGKSINSCGGRHPSEDIFKPTYALFIGGLTADPNAFETGVNKPYQDFESPREISDEFPYIAGPVFFDKTEAFNGYWLYKQTLEW